MDPGLPGLRVVRRAGEESPGGTRSAALAGPRSDCVVSNRATFRGFNHLTLMAVMAAGRGFAVTVAAAARSSPGIPFDRALNLNQYRVKAV